MRAILIALALAACGPEPSQPCGPDPLPWQVTRGDECWTLCYSEDPPCTWEQASPYCVVPEGACP